MNAMFQKLMGDAARLTSQGDLQAATAAIQEALGRMAPAAARPTRADTSTGAARDDTVIDVEAREVGSPLETAAWLEAAAAVKRAAVPGEILRGTYACAEGQRDWRLYVPPAAHALAAGQTLPLVVMLHGCTQDPDDFAAGTGMDDAAQRQGFFVLYPAQAHNANPQRCWNWFKHNHQQRDRGEPALLAGLTRDVMARHPIDPCRVYVAGLSAGGAMAAILADTHPDLFAAVGVHSGLRAGAANDLPSALAAMQGRSGDLAAAHGLADLPGLRVVRPMQVPSAKAKPANAAKRGRAGAQQAPHRSVPTIVFHGDQDHTVHPVNAEHIVAACTPSAAHDAANDATAGFAEETAQSPNGRRYTRRYRADEHGRQVVEHWIVHGAGHAWSGGDARGSYTDVQGPDATREMLRFFFAHAHARS